MDRKKRTVIPPMPPSNVFPVETDPFGSYTGVPLDEIDTPVQDADDL